MIRKIEEHISELDLMKKYPKELFYIGNLDLLKREKISIVGTRRPNQYTKNITYLLANRLAKRGIIVVSGGAMGVDAIAHKGAGADRTIIVAPNGLDIKTPQINKNLIEEVEEKGLIISQYREGVKATKYSFVVRNEIVVALGEILIITEAQLKSGSLRSAEFAKEMGKEIYVLSHRVDESEGTNYLLKNNLAKPIYDIDDFVKLFGSDEVEERDPFLEYCKSFPTLNEAISKFGNDTIFEYELEGKIVIEGNNIKII